MAGLGLVRRELERRNQLAEKKFTAELPVDQAGVFPDPSESCALCELLFEQRGSVHGGSPRRPGCATGQEAAKAHQTGSEHGVIVAAPGVAGDDSAVEGRCGHIDAERLQRLAAPMAQRMIMGLSVLATLGLGLFPGPLTAWTQAIAAAMLN